MPWKESQAIPEGDGPAPRQEKFGPDQSTLEDIYRLFEERFKRQLKRVKSHLDTMDVLADVTRRTRQHLVGLEQDARQPRLIMEANKPSDTKTRKHTESAAKAVQAMHGHSFSANGVDPDPICSTSFGVKVVVENGTAVSKSCLIPLEMRTTTAAGGLLPTGKTTTATWTTLDQSTLRLCLTEEKYLRTSTPSASYESSFWRNYLLAALSCRRVIETKSGQNRMLDPGGSEGRRCAARFWERGSCCFMRRLCVRRLDETATVFVGTFAGVVQTNHLLRVYCGQSLFSPQLGWL